MTDEELKIIYQLYTDLWKMFRQYHTARTDAEWDRLAEQAGKDSGSVRRGCQIIGTGHGGADRKEV